MKSALNSLMTVLLLAMPAAAAATPVGYSVNSDAPDGDTLHRVDLATGVATPVSDLQVLSSTTGVRKDIEGLAFDSDGVLWAVDEDSFRLFQISTLSGIVDSQGDVPISGLSDAYGNDFGMTFTCDGSLYISSVSTQTLYRLDLDGTASPVGAMGHNISALASWGKPAQLYGLGNGLDGEGQYKTDSRSLFSINVETGQATEVGSVGAQVSDYFEAGLSFSSDGTLWALVDRGDEPSQLLQIDKNSGEAISVIDMSAGGFESLAVASPGGCSAPPPSRDSENPTVRAVPVFGNPGRLLTLVLMLGTGLLAVNRFKA